MSSSASVAASRGSKSGASLSIVVLSTGSHADLKRAIDIMAPSIRRFDAQLIVAREDDGTSVSSLVVDCPKSSLVRAPRGATRAQLCDVGMAAATGDIVALRDDRAVQDCRWLESFAPAVRRSVPELEKTVADFSNLAEGNGNDRAMIDAVRRHFAASSRVHSGVDAPPRISVPLSDRRADSKRAVARDA
ncbi:MAG: hypothetical protein MNPFHGCM_02104 [Gemmatimonadaceae bacterium]|nr:hypothetical protein [Gemmatimonadaceae bacterium]